MLTQDRLKEVLRYNRKTGIFTWLMTLSPKAPAGSIAGCRMGTYISITIDRKPHKAHRLAWLYVTGKWPKKEIDHRNRCGDDNRWLNLREATTKQNGENRSLNSNSTSGFRGVHKSRGGYWVARIHHNGVRHVLGTFPKLDWAVKARVDAEKRLYTHSEACQ